MPKMIQDVRKKDSNTMPKFLFRMIIIMNQML